MSTESPWTLPEITQVAAHFQESLAQVLMPVLLEGSEPALLQVGDTRVQCDAVLGAMAKPPFACEFVALGAPGNWVVVSSSSVTIPATEVVRLIVNSKDGGQGDGTKEGAAETA
jgi:hypothetical protein